MPYTTLNPRNPRNINDYNDITIATNPHKLSQNSRNVESQDQMFMERQEAQKKSVSASTEWFVVNTNPRCEDRAARGLAAAGFTVFLPTYQTMLRRRPHRPARAVVHPLLTGYLFMEMPKHGADWWTARRVDGVRRILGTDERTHRIVGVGRKEVMEFMRLCSIGAFSPRDPERRPFAAGDKVFVRSGPFRGQTVHLDDVTGSKSARFLASIFGRLVPVDIGLDDIVAV